MSRDLDVMYSSILIDEVPEMWRRLAYPSRKSLSLWMLDLHSRLTFFKDWLEKGPPVSYCLPAFFFPQGLLTAALQQHARRYAVAIDDLELGTEVTGEAGPEALVSGDRQGILIHGLWIDGGRWDFASHTLEDPLPGVMFSPLPVVNLVPRPSAAVHSVDVFDCPMYKTSDRTGALSTTGQSTNFVMSLALPIRATVSPDYWVLRGVALLCMPDE
eukprot:jgi/Botrbrau1/7692/Bobra.0159s0130.1